MITLSFIHCIVFSEEKLSADFILILFIVLCYIFVKEENSYIATFTFYHKAQPFIFLFHFSFHQKLMREKSARGDLINNFLGSFLFLFSRQDNNRWSLNKISWLSRKSWKLLIKLIFEFIQKWRCSKSFVISEWIVKTLLMKNCYHW